ncbi:(d)CMP kinase [Zavarzinia sp. CC-PAN008]|uniref:(d)CMP kinase n=1 Tax=Zavarzinia sp. CC-PAN008 TaxID=3243332 RepID=UPI003F74646A
MVIAVDGPAASGKGTLARRLAQALGFAYLDTGKLYRAVAFALMRDGAAIEPAAAAAAARALNPALLAAPDLLDEAVGEMASRVAAMPEVRAALLAFQQDFAARPPPPARGAVLDGRDIGTVVCPDAAVKLFVTASLDARARRRFAELAARGGAVTLEGIRADLARRDARDSGRAAAPLALADGAHLLDTTDLGIEEAFAAAKALIPRE